ncbi:unnamed protein product [Soboliphyme baturini]|uniref:SCAPER_N domain-containing protein n=1 Tax=Soboliphyme baturini TaxID=241478 RepID=A0A183IMG8_9BILA|nr:unnamed protein product [Soboliphyme baturini]
MNESNRSVRHHQKPNVLFHGTGISVDDFKAQYWSYLFDNLRRTVDAIYEICQVDGSLIACKEAIMILENYVKDFTSLIEYLNLEELWDENKRPSSVAWEIRRSVASPKKSIPSFGFACTGRWKCTGSNTDSGPVAMTNPYGGDADTTLSSIKARDKGADIMGSASGEKSHSSATPIESGINGKNKDCQPRESKSTPPEFDFEADLLRTVPPRHMTKREVWWNWWNQE